MYAVYLSNIYLITFLGVLVWAGLNSVLHKKNGYALWRTVNFIGFILSAYIILSCTVLNRTPSDNHIYIFFAPYSNEFYREMVMNAFLYFPFGLTASVFIGPVSVLIAFILSTTIESWQYVTGSGVAQGTDVIMNTLGCAIGAVPWILVKTGVAEKAVGCLKQRLKQ